MGDKLVTMKNFQTLGLTCLMMSLCVIMLCFVIGYAEAYPWTFFAVMCPFGVLEMLAAFIFFIVLKKRYGKERWFFGYFKILRDGYVPSSRPTTASGRRSGRHSKSGAELSGSETQPK